MNFKISTKVITISLISLFTVVLLLTSASFASGDTVYFTDGTSQEGIVILDSEHEIWIEIDTGKNKAVVKVPKSSVQKVEKGTTVAQRATAKYNAKLEKMNPQSAHDWYLIGIWCEEQPALKNKSRGCFEKSVEIDPQYSPSHLKLGNVRYEGAWMDYDTMMLSRGYVKFRGSWMTVDGKMQIIIKEQELAVIREQKKLKDAEKSLIDAERKLVESQKAPARDRVIERERIVYREPVYTPLWYGISYYGSHGHYYKNKRLSYPTYGRYPYRSGRTRHHSNSGVSVSYRHRGSHSSVSVGFIFR